MVYIKTLHVATELCETKNHCSSCMYACMCIDKHSHILSTHLATAYSDAHHSKPHPLLMVVRKVTVKL